MIKNFLSILVLLFATNFLMAQDGEVKKYEYSYKTDMLFLQDQDLYGYTFYPNAYQHNNEEKTSVTAGDVSIHFTPSMAYFKGISALKKFNVISFNKTKEGYALDLLDTNNPTFRGTLEIIINAKNQCEGVLFFNKKIGQYAFFLPEKSEKQLEKEAEYFTLKENYKVANYTDIVGSTIKPFMQVKNQYANFEFEKIAPKDSVSIIFAEQYIDLKIGENERRFEIKTVDSKDYAGEDEDPQITRILETSWKTDKKFKIRFYLNSKNLVQKLELGPTLYYLMMTQ